MNRIEHNLQTGETTVIELTAEEIAQAQANTAEWETLQAEEQAQATAKASALAKLTALGLTQDEVKALLG